MLDSHKNARSPEQHHVILHIQYKNDIYLLDIPARISKICHAFHDSGKNKIEKNQSSTSTDLHKTLLLDHYTKPQIADRSPERRRQAPAEN